MTILVNKKAARQIAKLGKNVHDAIYSYLNSINGKSYTELKTLGMAELKGNLKGLLKFKHKSFIDYRLIGTRDGNTVIVVLCCEPRNSVYKNKDGLARKARHS